MLKIETLHVNMLLFTGCMWEGEWRNSCNTTSLPIFCYSISFLLILMCLYIYFIFITCISFILYFSIRLTFSHNFCNYNTRFVYLFVVLINFRVRKGLFLFRNTNLTVIRLYRSISVRLIPEKYWNLFTNWFLNRIVLYPKLN